jgi:hypothetical protein
MRRIFIIISILFAFDAYSQYKINEDFETPSYPPAGWTETDSYDIISRSTSASGFGFGTGSIKADFFNVISGSSVLNLPAFNTLTANDTLTFDYAYAPYTSPNPDSLLIKLSTDNGSTFSITLASYLLTDISTGTATDFEFVPGASQWATIKLKMNAAVTGNNTIVQFYFSTGYGNNLYIDNVRLGNTPTADVQVLSLENRGTQYFTSSAISPYGKYRNNGTAPATFNVTRTISPGGYTSTKTITNLAGGTLSDLLFDAFSFTAGNTYTVRDSVYLAGDGTFTNDTLSGSFTPNVAKNNLIYWNDAASKDSLVLHLSASSYAGTYDVISMSSYGGSLRAWRNVFVLFGNGVTWSDALRDSLKSFLDNSVNVEQKTLALFGNDIAYSNDPIVNGSASVNDTTFLRQYLKAKFIGDNWLTALAPASSTIKGINSFASVTSSVVTDASPDYIMPVNSGTAGFIPLNEDGTGDTATMVLYDGSEFNVLFSTNLYSKFSTGTNEVFNAIAQWVIDSAGVLPVELSNFTAEVTQSNVKLQWSTISEMNNAGFDVEKKTQNSTWSKIGFVNGHGTTNAPQQYLFNDKVSTGNYSYRLKQVDFNGNYKYYNLNSEIVIGSPKNFVLKQNYPNPFNPVTNIEYELPFDAKVSVNVYDITGKLAGTLVNEQQGAGYYRVQMDAAKLNLASGVYIYQIIAENSFNTNIKSLKMVLVK